MKHQKQFIAWLKGSFYPLTVYAYTKREARQKIKDAYGHFPYFLEINF